MRACGDRRTRVGAGDVHAGRVRGRWAGGRAPWSWRRRAEPRPSPGAREAASRAPPARAAASDLGGEVCTSCDPGGLGRRLRRRWLGRLVDAARLEHPVRVLLDARHRHVEEAKVLGLHALGRVDGEAHALDHLVVAERHTLRAQRARVRRASAGGWRAEGVRGALGGRAGRAGAGRAGARRAGRPATCDLWMLIAQQALSGSPVAPWPSSRSKASFIGASNGATRFEAKEGSRKACGARPQAGGARESLRRTPSAWRFAPGRCAPGACGAEGRRADLSVALLT